MIAVITVLIAASLWTQGRAFFEPISSTVFVVISMALANKNQDASTLIGLSLPNTLVDLIVASLAELREECL